VVPSELSNRLKRALDASIASELPEEHLERLSLRKAAGGGSGAALVDVVVLEYTLGRPLVALMPARVMARYAQISTFLLKGKSVEHLLQEAWLVRVRGALHMHGRAYMAARGGTPHRVCPQVLRRVERHLQSSLRVHIGSGHGMWRLLRLAHRLRSDMNSFCRHLLDYCTSAVIEGAWATLLADIDAVRPPAPLGTPAQTLLLERAPSAHTRAAAARMVQCA
jgi:Gamma tubulin complex component C-terminal